VPQVLTKPVGEKEAAAKDGKMAEIPIPDIRMTPSYEQVGPARYCPPHRRHAS